MIAVFLLLGTAVYFYTHAGTNLTFHSSWTETDRRQMKEIVVVLDRLGRDQRREQFDDLMNSFSFFDWESWPICFKGVYGRYLASDDYTCHYPVIALTARTGNASCMGEGNWTLLHLACGLGKRELARHLMDKGADVNLRTMEGGGHHDAPINWLVGGGIDTSQSLDADTALYLMEELASHGADLNVRAMEMIAPFEMLCGLSSYPQEEQQRMIFKLMELGADVSTPFESQGKKRSPLIFPVLFGHAEVVRRICELGVDAGEGYDCLPPLFYVNPSRRPENQVKIARTLLYHGANVNASFLNCVPGVVGDTGQTPLSFLCASFNEVKLSDEKIRRCFLDLLTLYLERKADVNQASERGMTPLMYLFGKGDMRKYQILRLELARKLLEHGADPSLKDEKGKTVADLILENKEGGEEILKKLPGLRPGK